MLRARAVEAKNGKKNFTQSQLAQMDRNGRLARFAAPLVNWASDKHNALTRPLMEKAAGIDRDAKLPKFHAKTFVTADVAIRFRRTAKRPPSASARRRSMPPASSITTSRRPAWRRARCSIISAWKPSSRIRAAAACRSWNRPISNASPRTRRRWPRNWRDGSTRATTSSR